MTIETYNNGRTKKATTAISVEWSNDTSLPLASNYVRGYSNKIGSYAYRARVFEMSGNSVSFILVK